MAAQQIITNVKPGHCTECGDAPAAHPGGKACTETLGVDCGAKSSIYALPVAKWAWKGDARNAR